MGKFDRAAMPTPEELKTWRSFIETVEVLRAQLGGRLQSESSLSTGDYQVLLALNEADDKTLRASSLASVICWERSRLSHHLGRMEKRGLVMRKRCPDDAHGVEVHITDAGTNAYRSASYPHLRAIRELFIEALSPEQLTHAAALTQALRAHLNLDKEG